MNRLLSDTACAKWLLVFASFLPLAAWADEVARVFGKSITMAELKREGGGTTLTQARMLRERATKEALERFVVANHLGTTNEDLDAHVAWTMESDRQTAADIASRIDELGVELENPNIDAKKREFLTAERNVMRKYDLAAKARRIALNSAPLIQQFKLYRALYEKYGGRVVGGILFGPEPVGAIEVLLREHEKRGDIAIYDPEVLAAFWDEREIDPRRDMSPENIDFSFPWLKPRQ